MKHDTPPSKRQGICSQGSVPSRTVYARNGPSALDARSRLLVGAVDTNNHRYVFLFVFVGFRRKGNKGERILESKRPSSAMVEHEAMCSRTHVSRCFIADGYHSPETAGILIM